MSDSFFKNRSPAIGSVAGTRVRGTEEKLCQGVGKPIGCHQLPFFYFVNIEQARRPMVNVPSSAPSRRAVPLAGARRLGADRPGARRRTGRRPLSHARNGTTPGDKSSPPEMPSWSAKRAAYFSPSVRRRSGSSATSKPKTIEPFLKGKYDSSDAFSDRLFSSGREECSPSGRMHRSPIGRDHSSGK